MRKILLGTTALAAAATLSANAALADVSISGYYEWRYESRSSNTASLDGTQFASDSEIKFMFTNKTDSGLDISMKQELLSDAGDSTVQESSISISGGFGTVGAGIDDAFGENDNDGSGDDMLSGVKRKKSRKSSGDRYTPQDGGEGSYKMKGMRKRKVEVLNDGGSKRGGSGKKKKKGATNTYQKSLYGR